MQPRTHLTVKEIAQQHDVHRRTVDRWLKSRNIPTFQAVPRGRRFIKVQDLDSLLIAKVSLKHQLDELIQEVFDGLTSGTPRRREDKGSHETG